MKKCLYTLLFSLVLTSNTIAATLQFAATLSPLQEVPPNTSLVGPGGTAGLVLDLDTLKFGWVISFDGLSSNALAAHFHKAPVGADGPIVVDIVAADLFSGTAGIGNTDGIFVGGVTLSALDAADVQSGLWYINIHTLPNLGGEIRGQVLSGTFNPVPLPAALWLMIPALGGLVARRRAT